MSCSSSKETVDGSHFVFIFMCKDEVIIDAKTGLFPAKSVSCNLAHSWNEIAIKISKKVCIDFRHCKLQRILEELLISGVHV